MSLSLLRRAILAQSIGTSLPFDVLSVRSVIAGASRGAWDLRNEQMGSFAAGASLAQRVPASTAASADLPPSKTYRSGTLAVKVGMTQGTCVQGVNHQSPFLCCALFPCDSKLGDSKLGDSNLAVSLLTMSTTRI